MKLLINSILKTGRQFAQDINPRETPVFWKGKQYSACPQYDQARRWEMLEVGFDEQSDITLRLVSALWPDGIPEHGDNLSTLGKNWIVNAITHTGDGEGHYLALVLAD